MARKYLRGASGSAQGAFSYIQSRDGMNYNFHYGSTRGTVTFDLTAAFWNEGNEIYTNDDECLESLSELEIHIV